MELLFWTAFAIVFYVYLGYPGVLMLWRCACSRPARKRACEPTVSIVIAAHNERDTIEARLQNCLALDYPKRKLQILVSLDGPTDGSEFIVWKCVPLGVELIHSKQHSGKATALNRALRRATGEIVVFADARQVFHPRAIRELVANFSDESVGAVSGELVLVSSPSELRHSVEESATDIGLYWRYEKLLRSMESDIHSIGGATGAIYAIRRNLYRDLPPDTILDDVLTPLRIVLGGMRAVFDPEAKAYDAVSCCALAEYGRKVRTLAGNYQLLAHVPQVLLPWRNPIFFQFLSHKLGRLVVPWALLALFITNVFMLRGIYVVTFSLQAAWYLCAVLGYVFAKRDTEEPVLALRNESKKAA
jgi:biofilm PGA synthesis N-glycosyltransferase PgaC